MNKPIGFFDSGVGGVTVLSAVRNILPDEQYIYFGDTGRVPYGSKSSEVVVDYSVQIANFLREMGAKMLIVACNTASAIAGKVLEDILDIPVIGVIKPTVKKAVACSKNNRIGVIGTRNTILSRAYRKEILALNPKVQIYENACPMLVPYIEENEINSQGFQAELGNYLTPLLAGGIDTLILGCTHYPLVKDRIQRIAGDNVALVDAGAATADDVYNIASAKKLLNANGEGKLTFYVTGGVKDFADKLERFGLPSVHIHQVEILNLGQSLTVQKAEEYKV